MIDPDYIPGLLVLSQFAIGNLQNRPQWIEGAVVEHLSPERCPDLVLANDSGRNPGEAEVLLQGLQEGPVHRPKGLTQQDVVCVDGNPGLARGWDLGSKDDACAHSALFADIGGRWSPSC